MKKKIIANAIARKDLMITKTVEWKNGSINVEFSFEPGCEGSKNKWGQLNEPDTQDEYQINTILFENNDVTKLFDDEDFELIIEKLKEIKEEYYA